uniref:Uncharacterized protein n=1 Tax=Arundo donax TaxID=35708 RepID=A0A0A8XUE8_ARUDO
MLRYATLLTCTFDVWLWQGFLESQ